ncbi:MAG: hypothetical protein ACN6NX_02680 [Acinetobacter sp.]
MKTLKKLKKLPAILAFVTATGCSVFSYADDAAASPVQPLTKEEIQKGITDLRELQNQRIEAWGASLKPEDFERSWFGRILKKPKRQEVCGIYQGIVDETLKLAVQNRSRLPEADQKLLDDRNAFIQSLGYQNNIVDTQMGFNCRLK